MKYLKILLLLCIGIILIAIFVFNGSFENVVKYSIIFFLVTTFAWIVRINFHGRAVIKNEQDLEIKEKAESKIQLFTGIWILIALLSISYYVGFGRAKYFIIFISIITFIGVISDAKKVYFNDSQKPERDLLKLPTALLIFMFIIASSISLILYFFHKNRGMFFEYNNEAFYFPLLLITSATALMFLLTIIRKLHSKYKSDSGGKKL